MWMLFVLSMVHGNEPKVTQYKAYIEREKCEIMQSVLTATFEDGEKAFCHYVKYIKRKD